MSDALIATPSIATWPGAGKRKGVFGKAVPCASPDENEPRPDMSCSPVETRRSLFLRPFTIGLKYRIRNRCQLDRLHVSPLNNARGAVVNLMNPSNVDTVFIAGEARKWRGDLVDLPG